MPCPYCKSNNIRHSKVHITKPIGSKKNTCLQCNKNFITHIEQTNNNITQRPYYNYNK